jgi:hypothetical protein
MGIRPLQQVRDNSRLDSVHASQVLATLLLGRALVLHEAAQEAASASDQPSLTQPKA